MKRLILFLLLSLQIVYPQKRYLVSKFGDVVPIENGKSASSVLKELTARSVAQSCGTQEFGYYPPKYNIDNAQYGLHKDILAMWFEAPSSGTIDTVFWLQNTVCALDSTLFVRIFHSNIYTNHGPGWNGYPAPQGAPDVTCWGYYISTNDEDGIAAFPEDSTGPWVSTVDSFRYSPHPSFPPTGSSIWGLAGYPVHVHENKINYVVMNDLVPITVNAGDPFFITFRINGDKTEVCNAANNTSFDYSNESDTLATHDWKYYEYSVGTTIPCKGWVARGSWNLMFWYVMTPTTNTPPIVNHVDLLHNTTSNGPQTFTCNIYDCDAANSLAAGVRNAWVRYSLDSEKTWITDNLQNDGNDQYEYTLPGANPTHVSYYKVVADDSLGAMDSSGVYSYKVVTLDDAGWYRIDTLSGCTSAKLTPGGHVIDTTQWFIASHDFAGQNQPHRGDDGTAGPFAIANGFVYFGDTMHYAWVGVDGAIALSKTATDTIDVNSAGFGTNGWDLPFKQHHSRADTINEANIPKAFIAPYWADWVNKQDSPLATFGHVRYNDAPNKFVVEWDSLGDFDAITNLANGDIEAFRVVLNKTDYSIEFQYDEVGYGGLDTANLTGIQCDSLYHPQPAGQNPPYAYYNKDGYPVETHLHNGLCLHYVPVLFSMATTDGWNLLSVPSSYQNQAKTYLYPTANSAAFIYNAGYQPVTTLSNGAGFWLKFSGAQTQEAIGRALTCFDIPVIAGWNIIGSISIPVPVSNITADPATGIGPGSTFFYYDHLTGYNVASTISPGLGYWVRSLGSGFIHLCPGGALKIGNPYAELNTLNKITISQNKSGGAQTLYIGSGSIDADKYQLPPRAPEGALDVRFASNRMVEIYPSLMEDGKKYEYPIVVSATQFPLTIKWEEARNSGAQASLTLKTEDGKVLASMNSSGKITLTDASVKKLIVAVNAGIAIPTVFALSRNYPNPFNPTTRFSVDVPRNSQVDVSVYDILGRKIVTLWNGEQSAGYHTMEWDGKTSEGLTAPTGMYFIRMSAPTEQFSATQKVMLMK
jgi:hypothetical protein